MTLDEFRSEVYEANRAARERSKHFDDNKVKDIFFTLSESNPAAEKERESQPTQTPSASSDRQDKDNGTHNHPNRNNGYNNRVVYSRPTSVLDPLPAADTSTGQSEPRSVNRPDPISTSGTRQTKPPASPNIANRSSASTKKPASTEQPNLTDNVYIAPPVLNTTSAVASYNHSTDDLNFGIFSNSWLEVALERKISSADTGTVELRMEQPFFGRYDTLPEGTAFIAKANFNDGTRRVDLQVFQAILPDGREVNVRATAYDIHGRNGLMGTIVRDRSSEIADAAGSTAIALGKEVIDSVTPDSIIGSGVDSMSNELLNNENEHRPRKRQAVSIVAPQPLKLKIDKSF